MLHKIGKTCHTSPGACQPGCHLTSNIFSYTFVCDLDAAFYMVFKIIHRWKLFIPGYENHRRCEKPWKVLQKFKFI